MEISGKRKCFYTKSIFKFFFLSEINVNINDCLKISNLLNFISCLARNQNLVIGFQKWYGLGKPCQLIFFDDLFETEYFLT